MWIKTELIQELNIPYQWCLYKILNIWILKSSAKLCNNSSDLCIKIELTQELIIRDPWCLYRILNIWIPKLSDGVYSKWSDLCIKAVLTHELIIRDPWCLYRILNIWIPKLSLVLELWLENYNITITWCLYRVAKNFCLLSVCVGFSSASNLHHKTDIVSTAAMLDTWNIYKYKILC